MVIKFFVLSGSILAKYMRVFCANFADFTSLNFYQKNRREKIISLQASIHEACGGAQMMLH